MPREQKIKEELNMLKKALSFAFLCSLLIILSSQASLAVNDIVWSATSGPVLNKNLKVFDVEVDESNVNNVYVLAQHQLGDYAGYYAVFRSTDGGQSWIELEKSRKAFTVYEGTGYDAPFTILGIKAEPGSWNRLYAWGGVPTFKYGGVWYSSDRGENWTRIYGADSYGYDISGCYTSYFAIAPSNHDCLYRGIDDREVVDDDTHSHFFSVSKDKGASWTDVDLSGCGIPYDSGRYEFGLKYLAVHPTNESVVAVSAINYFSSSFNTAEAGVYISTNEGQSFYLSLPSYPNYKYDGDLASEKSTPFIAFVEFDPDNPSNMRAIKTRGRYRPSLEAEIYVLINSSPEVYDSTDSGKTWTSTEASPLISELYNWASVTYAEVDPADFDRIYYVGSNIWRSEDGGQTWVGNAPISSRVDSLDIYKADTRYLWGGDNNSPILRLNTNYGDSAAWGPNLENNMEVGKYADMVFYNPNYRGNLFTGYPVRRTTNFGSTWLAPEGSKKDMAFDPNNKGIAFRIDNSDVEKTTNSGQSWQDIYSVGYLQGYFQRIESHPYAPDTLWATLAFCSNPRIEKSTDGGYNWSILGPTGTSEVPYVLAVNPVTPETMYKGGGGGGSTAHMTTLKGIWKSTNGGVNWTDVSNTNTLTVSAIAVDPNNPETVYVGTGAAGMWNYCGKVYRSTNGGANWSLFGGDPKNPSTGVVEDNVYVKDLFVDPINPKKVYCLFLPADYSSAEAVICRTYYGYYDNWRDLSTGKIKNQYNNNVLELKKIDIDAKKGQILAAATGNGVYLGIDYDEVPAPEISALWPPLGSNFYNIPLQIYGSYFIDVDKVYMRGPFPSTQQIELTLQSSNFALISAQVPAGLAVGTYEVWVATKPDPPGTDTLTSEAAIFEIITENVNGPEFKNVKFDDQVYLDQYAPMPVKNAPVIKARIYDHQGINDQGFSYYWKNINRPDEDRRVTDQSEFTFTFEIFSVF